MNSQKVRMRKGGSETMHALFALERTGLVSGEGNGNGNVWVYIPPPGFPLKTHILSINRISKSTVKSAEFIYGLWVHGWMFLEDLRVCGVGSWGERKQKKKIHKFPA